MSELSVKAAHLTALDIALAGVMSLNPPPTPKGRYALAKAVKVIGPAHQTYQEQHLALLRQHAATDEKGEPKSQAMPNGVQFDLGAGFGVSTPAFDADVKALNDEDIPLTGCRMITHAELGACPITVQQEAVLLGVLLVDEEPA